MSPNAASDRTRVRRAFFGAPGARWLRQYRPHQMRWLIAAVAIVACLEGCGRGTPTTPRSRLDTATQSLASAGSAAEKFYALGEAAKESFVVGHPEDARGYAEELLRLAPQFGSNWNYGNAIHDGNMVLGRVALKEGRKSDAIRRLHVAGDTPGSPQLNSFGPNMSLADDLLRQGERQAVLDYFEQCRRFWKLGGEKLTRWAAAVQNGEIPAFGANLIY